MSSRTLTLHLRREAELEAIRLLAARRRTLGEPFESTREILLSAVRVAPESPLQPPCAIFFLDGWIVDAAGRALERQLVPVKLAAAGIRAAAKRRDVRAQAQGLLERHGADAISTARNYLKRRAVQVAAEFGRGLASAMTREARVLKSADDAANALVQAGLFDLRALKNRQAERRGRSESVNRMAALRAGTVAISSREPEIVLLLIVGSRT